MNRQTKMYIDAILSAETTYTNTVGNALLQYRDSEEKINRAARAYKDEQSYKAQHLPAAQQVARDAMGRAEMIYRKAIQDSVTGLKNELKASINAPISSVFTQRLAFYRTANLTPTRTETEALLTMAGKNPLAIRAVAKLLDDQKAPIMLECRAISEYETDLKNLDDLATMPLLHAPYEVHTEMCECMKGQEKATLTANGWKMLGSRWSGSVELLMQQAAVTERIKAIEKAADTWSADVTYSLREREHAAAVAKAKEEAENNGEEYTPEREPVSSVHVEKRDNEAVEMAAQLGKETAKNAEVLKNAGYLR